jgi:peptidoglycan/LPS O-acetylase OafA/YrhL
VLIAPSHGSRLDAFDGLRACAALSVVAYHVCLATGGTANGAVAPVLSELKAGVTVFFVISGFVLYLPYARAIRDGGALPDWRNFARRRAVRILPGYWAALTILAFGPLSASVLTPSWWRFYGFGQIYHSSTILGGLGVAWSLCVEVSFYAVLPALAAGMTRLARRSPGDAYASELRVIGALAAGSLVLRLGLAGSMAGTAAMWTAPVEHGAVLGTSLPGLLDWFALGMGLAVLRAEWETGRQLARWLAELAHRPWCCWSLALALYAAGVPMQHGDTFLPLYGLGTHATLGLAAAAFVLPAVAVRSGDGAELGATRPRPIALLTHPTMAWVGTISYGIYLWHKQVLDAIDANGTRFVSHASTLGVVCLLAVTVAGAVVLGAASWYLVERPAQRRWRPAPSPATRRPFARAARPAEPGQAQLEWPSSR